MTIDDINKLIYVVTCPPRVRYPGIGFNMATEMLVALIVSNYINEDIDPITLIQGTGEDSDSVKIGRAFCAAVDRNRGNKYASILLVDTLQQYNGQEVSGKVSALLETLEQFLVNTDSDVMEESELH